MKVFDRRRAESSPPRAHHSVSAKHSAAAQLGPMD